MDIPKQFSEVILCLHDVCDRLDIKFSTKGIYFSSESDCGRVGGELYVFYDTALIYRENGAYFVDEAIDISDSSVGFFASEPAGRATKWNTPMAAAIAVLATFLNDDQYKEGCE